MMMKLRVYAVFVVALIVNVQGSLLRTAHVKVVRCPTTLTSATEKEALCSLLEQEEYADAIVYGTRAASISITEDNDPWGWITHYKQCFWTKYFAIKAIAVCYKDADGVVVYEKSLFCSNKYNGSGRDLQTQAVVPGGNDFFSSLVETIQQTPEPSLNIGGISRQVLCYTELLEEQQ
eukprot:GILJ01000621.1.p1 GENE.GILJ01000621.1~~GILJ01000621.1.p1  ORF type:complete len:177 (-),score=25.38 GILJ01000621.1:412-942(-)